ncbi:hypothetical protein LEMLEM_LOCUS1683 [Lemmus lemmus]
MTKTQ